MATLDAKNRSELALNILAEISAAWRPQNWIATSGRSITYEVATTLDITAVSEDESALTERASVADVDSNAGSWYLDRSAQILYISTATGDPFDKVIIATVAFWFSKQSRIFNDTRYEPRIVSTPKLTLRIEEDFSDVATMGGGTLRLDNHDGYFDALNDLGWDGGTVQLLAGYELTAGQTDASDYADYSAFGSWRVDRWTNDDDGFSIKLREAKSILESDIPFELYDQDTYPELPEENIGQPIPRAYGKLVGVEPVQIEPSTKTFKVAGHAIHSLLEVRVLIDDVWTKTTPTAIDLANGQFSLGSDFEADRSVSCDFIGRVDSNSRPMVNASDVVKDILEYMGETSFDSSSFSTARAALLQGHSIFGEEVHRRAVALYIDELEEAKEWVSRINQSVHSFLYMKPNGEWYYEVFKPQPSEGLDYLTENDISKFRQEKEYQDVLTRVSIAWSVAQDESVSQNAVIEDDAARIERGLAKHITDDIQTVLTERRDAEHLARRIILTRREPSQTLTIATFWQTLEWLPGKQFVLAYDRRDNEEGERWEVLSIDVDPVNGITNLRCGPLRVYGRNVGFYGSSSSAFPARLGGATITAWDKTWTEEQKSWARQNLAFIHDSDGFADNTDADGHKVTVIS